MTGPRFGGNAQIAAALSLHAIRRAECSPPAGFAVQSVKLSDPSTHIDFSFVIGGHVKDSRQVRRNGD
jgi:hypothetical protein